MSDLAIRGGRVVTAGGVIAADVHVLGGTIVSISDRDDRVAREEIDARGLVVLPGVVDAHVHVNEPGRAEWEGWLAATRGAAAGGVTTIADMPLNSIPPTLDADAFDAKYEAASANAIVDFALWGGLVDIDADRLRELAECGVVGVKGFLCASGVDEFPALAAAELEPALAAARNAGLLVALHCEDDALVSTAVGGADAWLASRPLAAELAAVERVAAAARATGASVHVVHASSSEVLAAVRAAQRAGADITAETCPHYLTFDASDVARVGTALKCAPPIRDGARAALWRDVASGRVAYVASDHSPCARALKEPRDGHFTSAWGGVSGLQTTLAVLLTDGVHDRGMSLELVADLVATRPAKRLGIWPRKGEVRIGTSADLVLVDLDREWTFSTDMLETRSGLSPYVGRRFRGRIERTLVRGRTVYADGKVTGAPGDGWFVQRVNV